ncbi:sensor histidine kinase [Adlercreutzia sp. ZJ141]|uniref:sensor histidine kinase n=1 Tax=Adlercreutzia sp. ZJ141 TaxID=2709406 RepID=UPI0013ED200C|nr:HAMP domain-containing sensor histidine kinase [Adlercreutzia sp. ZJ141]
MGGLLLMLFAAVGLPVWAGYRLGVSRSRVSKELPSPPRPLVDSYDDVDRLRRRRRARRRGFAGFFIKQLTSLLVFVIAVAVIDFVLFVGLSIHERDLTQEGTQLGVTRTVDEGLVYVGDDVDAADAEGEAAAGDATDAGAEAGWELSQEARDTLDGMGAWAMLLDGAGQVLWEYHVPDDVPRSFTLNDVAVMARHTNINEYYAAFWDRDDGLLVIGFPREVFWTMRFTYPATVVERLPLYVALFFGANVAMLFVYLLILRRRTRSAIDPIDDALVALSRGRAVDLNLRGDLAEVGDSIARASEELRRKDQARALWIRGVSHDIRTPLSLITGYADGIAESGALPEHTRLDAALIRSQSMRIKDLVYDLNIASRLEYDMQPLDVGTVSLPRMLRETVAEHLNETAFDRCEFDVNIAPDAVDLELNGDARLLQRAIRNVLQNAASHNPDGCKVFVSLAVTDVCGGAPSQMAGPRAPQMTGPRAYDECQARIVVRDDGCGLAADKLAQLRWRLEAAVGRTAESAATSASDASAVHDGEVGGASVSVAASTSAPNSVPTSASNSVPDFASSSVSCVGAAKESTRGFESALVGNDDASTHGLGLVLVAKIVRAHKGEMQVDSEVGQGFSVTINLPAHHGGKGAPARTDV